MLIGSLSSWSGGSVVGIVGGGCWGFVTIGVVVRGCWGFITISGGGRAAVDVSVENAWISRCWRMRNAWISRCWKRLVIALLEVVDENAWLSRFTFTTIGKGWLLSRKLLRTLAYRVVGGCLWERLVIAFHFYSSWKRMIAFEKAFENAWLSRCWRLFMRTLGYRVSLLLQLEKDDCFRESFYHDNVGKTDKG